MSTAWTRSDASPLSPVIWCGAAGIDVTATRGRFISIEGGEGAGKSTQAGLLVAALDRAGIPARATREPGGSPGGEAIRQLLLEGEGERWDAISEALLLVAARRGHVARVIALLSPKAHGGCQTSDLRPITSPYLRLSLDDSWR